jgi:hypothetical protein
MTLKNNRVLYENFINTSFLTLKFLETKNWSIVVWAAYVKKSKFFSIFSFRRVNYIFHKLFREHQARPIPTLYEPVVNFC